MIEFSVFGWMAKCFLPALVTDSGPSVEALEARLHALRSRDDQLAEVLESLSEFERQIDLYKVPADAPEGSEATPADLAAAAWMQHPSPHWITRVEGDDDIMELSNLAYSRFYQKPPGEYFQTSNYQTWATRSAFAFGENNRIVLSTGKPHYFLEPLWNYELDSVEMLLALKSPVLYGGRVYVAGESVVERNQNRLWASGLEELDDYDRSG